MIEYADLLGLPWTEMDCRGVVQAAYARAGSPLPADALEGPELRWEPSARPWRVLDVIACGVGGYVAHLAVVVRTFPRVMALTSGARTGVILVSVTTIQNVVGVYRRAAA